MVQVLLPRRELTARFRALSVRFEHLHRRYARIFWTLHSVWALITGVAVLVLAHNRYGFLPWVVVFLALTWGTTLFFSRLVPDTPSPVLRFAQGFASYLTRIMYQETLFFLIPFYLYSTTWGSFNSVYVVLIGALAVLSCFDLVFDRLLRTNRAFALGFFALVSFSALQFFFPILLRIKVHNASYLAGSIAFLAALGLAYSWRELRHPRRLAATAIGLVFVLGAVHLLRPIVPPVPLRLAKLKVAAELDPTTLRSGDDLGDVVRSSALARGKLYVVATLFAPTELPTSIAIHTSRDGRLLRSSRTVELAANPSGFRVWDGLSAPGRGFPPGRYTVDVRTGEGQLVGRRTFSVVP